MEYTFEVVRKDGTVREFEVISFHQLENLFHEWYDEDSGDYEEITDNYGSLIGYTVYV